MGRGVSLGRDYVFLYLGLVAVLAGASGFGPGLAAAALSFLLVDYFFVPPVGTLTIADEQDILLACWKRDLLDRGAQVGRQVLRLRHEA